jgi:zinc/manganese transport system substrate-binding protein
MARIAAGVCALAVVTGLACGSDRATRGEGTIDVVATTVPLADIVRNTGGQRVRVTTLVPRRANPHEWHLRPGDREAIEQADLLVLSGGSIDAWAAGAEADRSVTLLPRVDPLGADPHWWLDPVRAQRGVKEIRNELARTDVHGAGYYEAAAADFLARLRKLDRQTRTCLVGLAGTRERLATQHDAFAYFGDRYGIRFASPARATVGRRLWGDTLGPEGSASGTYLGAMATNVEEIVSGLSEGRRSCRPHP